MASTSPMGKTRVLGTEELDRLEPLWLALHAHHVRIAPRLAGMLAVSAAESWRRRRARYIDWVKTPGAFVLGAEADGELLGYAFVRVDAGHCSWNGGDRQAQLETLSVAPAMRGLGVGIRLLDAVRQRLHAAGIESIALTA